MVGFFSSGACGYYDSRTTRNHSISDPHHALNQRQLTRILDKGYRRFGSEYYRPFCRDCRECTPFRVAVAEFKANRSFRRTLRRNAAVEIFWGTPKATAEKFELYVRYQMSRHIEMGSRPPSSLRNNLASAMLRQMYNNPASSLELVLREGKKLLGFAIFDVTENALSAVYSIFDPTLARRSLGTFNILQSIEKCRELQLPYLNLGLYLAHHPKMAYKANFTPAQIYRNFSWSINRSAADFAADERLTF